MYLTCILFTHALLLGRKKKRKLWQSFGALTTPPAKRKSQTTQGDNSAIRLASQNKRWFAILRESQNLLPFKNTSFINDKQREKNELQIHFFLAEEKVGGSWEKNARKWSFGWKWWVWWTWLKLAPSSHQPPSELFLLSQPTPQHHRHQRVLHGFVGRVQALVLVSLAAFLTGLHWGEGP